MKIVHLKNSEIDIEKWDNAVKESKNSLVYAYSFYLDITAPGWNALIYNDYSVIMPLPVKQKFGIKYIYQPYFTQQSGIFFRNSISEAEMQNFINSIPKSIKFIEANFNYKNLQIENYAKQKVNFVLNLNNTYECLCRQYSSNAIRNLKKSKKNNFKLLNNNNLDELIAFKKNNSDTKLPSYIFDTLRSLFYFFHKRNQLKTYTILFENEIISYAVFLLVDNRAYYLSGASNDKGKSMYASFYIFDEFIKEYSGNNLILDFEGSEIPGIARFFKSLGASPVNYYFYKQNKLPLWLRLLIRK